jgi:hypothetical protein
MDRRVPVTAVPDSAIQALLDEDENETLNGIIRTAGTYREARQRKSVAYQQLLAAQRSVEEAQAAHTHACNVTDVAKQNYDKACARLV